MKFGVKHTGNWKKIDRTFRRRKERMEAMRKRIMRDLVEVFEKEVKDPLQNEIMNAYKESIEPRVIKTSMREGELAYALVSNPKPLEVSDLSEENHVVYVLPKGQADSLGQLLIEYSPWVKSRLPKNLGDVVGIRMTHRQVSNKEVAKVRALNDRMLKDHAREFARADAQLPKDRVPEPPKSVPDIMFQALRMEFGIMSPFIPHWGRAYKMRMAILKGLFKDKKKYTRYVVDANFNGWTQKLKKWKPLSLQRFKTQYAQFEKKITGG